MRIGLLGTQTRQFPAILQYCNRELQATFGMELIETRARGMNAEKVALEAEQARKASRNSQRQKNTQRDVSEEEEGTQANAPAASKGMITLSYCQSNDASLSPDNVEG